MKTDLDISVVILCYQAGNNVYDFAAKTARLLEKSGLAWEIILVGNYLERSDDKTPEIVKSIASKTKNVKAVALPKKGMMGWDARSGLEDARGNFICLIDGDEQMPFEDILRVYDKIKSESLDFVQTYRMIRHDGIKRKSISAIYNFLFKILFSGTGFRDINSKPKILTKDAYGKMNLTSDDWFIDAEMVIQSRKLKLGTGEIPTTFFRCNYRKSYVNFHAVFEFIRNLFSARIRESLK